MYQNMPFGIAIVENLEKTMKFAGWELKIVIAINLKRLPGTCATDIFGLYIA